MNRAFACWSLAMVACSPGDQSTSRASAAGEPRTEGASEVLTVATFNIHELTAAKVDQVDDEGRGSHPQLLAAARIIEEAAPDVLVLNEVDLARLPDGTLDHDDLGGVVRRFVERYLDEGRESASFPHLFVAPSNTGLLTGLDANADGSLATALDEGSQAHGDDSHGFGTYPGQYSMAVLSKYPFANDVRTFQTFRWRDLTDHHMPPDFYAPEVADVLRLSSKSHWDVPVQVGDGRLRLWVSHPTPPVFDGEEDRNGRRNFDEIGFWARYLNGDPDIYDDAGVTGAYSADEPFVIMGDLNADPDGGDATLDGVPAISQLLEHPGIQNPTGLRSVPTASFGGGLRVDYVLPAVGLEVLEAGVIQPDSTQDLEGVAAATEASDHRLVWVRLRLPLGG